MSLSVTGFMIEKDMLIHQKKLKISYSGAFPMDDESNNFYDYQGVIALNGKTLLATNYSKWYPVIYDTKNDTEILDMTYDFTVPK